MKKNKKKIQKKTVKAKQVVKKTTKKEQSKWRYPLIGILVISFLAYLPALSNGILGWDDNYYITENPYVLNFDFAALLSEFVMGNYHPFTMLVLGIEYQFFGTDPFGYHLVNILLHLVNTYLVFKVFTRLTKPVTIALVVALLFGIHPLHVESVAWIAELKDLLYTCFFLASYYFYLKYLDLKAKKYFWFALLLFLCSLLSKAMAASLPVLFLLTDYFKGRKFDAKSVLSKAPFFALSLFFGVLAIVAQKSSEAIADMEFFSFVDRIAFAAYGFITYLVKLVVPIELSAFYPYPVKVAGGIDASYYLYIVAALALVGYTFYTLKKSKKLFFGLGFFLITIFLVLQLLPVGSAIMADRYTYIPSIGIFYLAAEGFNYLWNKPQKALAGGILAIFSIFFILQTYNRTKIWENDLSLWNDVIEQYQTVPRAYYNRANTYSDAGRVTEALADYQKAIELRPSYVQAYVNSGNIYRRQKKYAEALNNYNTALSQQPDFHKAIFNRGNAYMEMGQYEQAIQDFTRAVEIEPTYYKAYINRASVYFNQQRFEEAITDCEVALSYQEVDGVYFNKAIAEQQIGRFNDACISMRKAAALNYKPAKESLASFCKGN